MVYYLKKFAVQKNLLRYVKCSNHVESTERVSFLSMNVSPSKASTACNNVQTIDRKGNPFCWACFEFSFLISSFGSFQPITVCVFEKKIISSNYKALHVVLPSIHCNFSTSETFLTLTLHSKTWIAVYVAAVNMKRVATIHHHTTLSKTHTTKQDIEDPKTTIVIRI